VIGDEQNADGVGGGGSGVEEVRGVSGIIFKDLCVGVRGGMWQGE